MKSSLRARVFAMLLSIGMVLSLFPAPALAEALDEMQAALTEQQESPAQDTGGESEEAPSDDEETPKEEKSEKGESTPQDALSDVQPQGEDTSSWPSFDQSSEVEGVRILVEAPEGTFPAGARLVATKATNEQREQATAAVDEVRPDDQNVARTYIYDIKVTDEQGTELQPANDHEVKVSFALAQETGEAVEANVYHVVEQPEANELEAEQLKTEVDDKQGIVRAQTDGFSVYVVQLTYGGLNYQMPFGSSVELQKILDAVGIKGEAGLAQVFPKDNNPLIFSVQKLQDTWFVVSSQNAPDDAANAKGQLVVDAGGSRYTIELTAASAGMVTIHKEWVDAEGLPLEPQDDQLAVTINYTVTNPPAEEDEGDPAPVPGGGSEDPAPASGYVASGTLTLDEGNDWSQTIAVPEPFLGTITLEEEAIPGFKATEWVLNNENRYVLPFDGTKATLDLSKFYDEQGAYDTANVNAIIEDGTAKITVANESTSEGVDYVNRWWDGSSVQQQTLRIYDAGGTLHNVEYLIRDGWDGAMQDGHWYVVRGEAVLPDMRFTVQGTAHLILCDGAKLTLGQGIQVPQGATLNVYGQESDSGELIATAEKGNAGIGGNSGSSAGTIVIQGGNVSSRGGESASGIGAGFGAGAQYENVNILGGSVTSYGGFYGAGIGGGQDNRNIGTTTIYGGTVAATGGMRAAGMGSGMYTNAGTVDSSGSVVIEGGDVHATGQGEDDGRSGGAGIGGGSNAPGCTVTINRGSVEAIGGVYAAGIGGGSNGGGGAVFATGGVVTINGGTVVANGGNQGAGIGGGLRGANTKVVVAGGDVTARGGNTAAGIGSGGDVPSPKFAGEVSLEGGSTKAFGGIGGAGIGGGTDCDGATLRITGGEMYASGGKNAAGIGGGGDGPDSGTSGGNGGDTTIEGGHVTAQGGENGAGIGSGEGSSFDSSAMGGVTVIKGGTVFATGGDDGAGIGGGQHANGNQVTISGGLVNAAGGIDAAGIGCGLGASGGNVTITGGIVDAISPKGGAGIGGGSNSSGANVTVTGGIVVANAGAEDIRAIGKGEQPFISFNSDKDLTLGDAIGCTYGKRANIPEGVATKETRVARCRDHSYVRLENLANSIEVRVAWTDPNSDQHPDSIKIAYRQRKRDGTVVRSGTMALPKDANGAYTGRVFVEPDFDGTIEFEESAIDGYRIKTWDFGVPAQGDGEAQTYDTASNAGEKSYPPYQFDPMAKPDAATAIRSGTGVCTVTNEPYLPLVIRKAWPGNDEADEATLPEQVSIQYTLANATGSAQPAALTLKPSDDGKNKAWEGAINLATQGGERYDVVTLKEDPVPDGFLAKGWKLDVGSIDEGLVRDVPSAGSQERDKATARLVLNTRESTPFSEGELTKIWQAIKAEKATVTITNAVSKTFHVQKEWLSADQQAPKPQSIQAQLARRVVANDGKVTWEGLQTVVLSEQNDWSADFSPVAASDDDEYIIRELTRDDKMVYAATDDGAPADWTGEVDYEVGPEDGKHIEYYVASYAYGQDDEENEDPSKTIITNAASQEFSVRKTWVLGSHTSERPAAVSAVLQRADDGDEASWTTVQTVELNEQNDWRATFKRVPSVERGEDGEVTQISYRVRELDKDGEVVC
ncbi:MAG: hypothetical protein IKG21_07530, partial [Atopobiaceae bacterium]|nr:hypothetical protein [Atopobiaceae bacterium]